MSDNEQLAQGQGCVRHYERWAFGAGIVPIPVVDMVAITAIQLRMIDRLSDIYEIPFSEHRVRSIIAALLGGILPGRFAMGWAGSLIRAVPLVGPVLGLFTMPVFGAASTYAVGTVFLQHFECGGTLLDFDPACARERFQESFEEGQKEHSSKARAKSKPSVATA